MPGIDPARLLAIVADTWRELQKRNERLPRITLDSVFDRDLGFDSLGRVELLARAEAAFGVVLPETALQEAATPRELLALLACAAGRPAAQDAPAMPLPIMPVPEGDFEPHAASTLLDILDAHAERHPERTQIIYLGESGQGQGESRISYGGLREQARTVAAGLQAQGLLPRQTVAIMLPTSPEYFYAYLGILIAGGVPVPIYPPARLSQIEEHVRRHTGILANAEAGILITVPQAMGVARLLEANVPVLRRVVTVEALTGAAGNLAPVKIEAGDTAFIQYTSGSTGNPKGVVLSHANLLANIRAIGAALNTTPADVVVSWLPLYHDMGLIAAWLSSLYYGNAFVVTSPLSFLAHPERWLQAIHRYRGTLTAAPNFAYELCCKRIGDAAMAGVDLSSLRMAANGAEPVSPETLTRFIERFAAYGFRAEAMAPVYGLAECSVGLAVPPMGRGPRIDRIEREHFMRRGRAIPAAANDATALAFVACGLPLPGHEIRIVDDTGQEVGDRVEGQLQFKGPSATTGYYRNPEATRQLRQGEWLDSGDRAYLAGGEVVITGRFKDIVIRGGRNIYPHEVEAVVSGLPGVRSGCVAAFGSRDAESGTERLIVLAESKLADEAARKALIDEINRATVDILGEPPDEVVLAPAHSVLKTSSGKLRRSACRELYESGGIGRKAPSPAMQLLRLFSGSALPQVRRYWARFREIGYAVRFWIAFAILAPLVWLAVVVSWRPALAWTMARGLARLFFRLAGLPLSVKGAELVPLDAPSVLVANHASYLDGLVLMAVLPRPYAFVAKQELKGHWIPRLFLQRLGIEFVERFDARRSADDAERLAQAAHGGRSLGFFPEGTFKRMPGLLPFHLGAFVAAARARVPVVPVAFNGTRSILRGDNRFPRRGAIAVTFGVPIAPENGDTETFAAAVRLRDAAREAILPHCGEPSMD
ncbi:MAG: AMP-binding protein [Betaproteobacteria bacterium]